MKDFFSSKPNRLWLLLSGFFLTNALVAEFIGMKLFSLERTFGFAESNWSILGQSGLSFTLTAGVLLWPFVFVMTDVINEYYGKRGVKLLSYITAGLISYGFLMIFFAIKLVPAEFWRTSHLNPNWDAAQTSAMQAQVGDLNSAFGILLGQSLWIIVGSLTAFLIGQVLDAAVFEQIKKRTGEKQIWLRATGSTLVSQFIDSFVVIFIAFYIGSDWSFARVLAISIMSYTYKALMAFALTPVIYGVHFLIDRYLGEETARLMRERAVL